MGFESFFLTRRGTVFEEEGLEAIDFWLSSVEVGADSASWPALLAAEGGPWCGRLAWESLNELLADFFFWNLGRYTNTTLKGSKLQTVRCEPLWVSPFPTGHGWHFVRFVLVSIFNGCHGLTLWTPCFPEVGRSNWSISRSKKNVGSYAVTLTSARLVIRLLRVVGGIEGHLRTQIWTKCWSVTAKIKAASSSGVRQFWQAHLGCLFWLRLLPFLWFIVQMSRQHKLQWFEWSVF